MVENILTERLRLREPKNQDVQFLKLLFSDEQVFHFVASSEDRAANLIEEMTNQSADKLADKIYWLAERKLDDVQVGYISAFRCNTPRVEIVFAVSPNFRRCGYGREMIGSLTDYLCNVPQTKEIIAVINYWNNNSKRIVEGLGFKNNNPLSSVYVKQIKPL